ncbi:efflux RND transporter periplasmic adaptor subunit [Psychrobium sp. MM17-31]|uniref:efflux RND transporter periplasmic adaptor subunit n=1 Tax=Psychrobium sp. MM17-31 TaxID=2917758 RepID=UPI001EF524A8|nr:efflux RND transporter periplasmic adaptor subunit [Psychrobium sp. MM17-31]MCG7532302.1 efflux RND transporter periplasmic adaptor subunit [Psychrobium sp. MM17-31]
MRALIINTLLLAFACSSFIAVAKSTEVEVIYAKLQAKSLEITLSGNVQAQNDAQLATQESGVVQSILVDAGDNVTKGQVLLTLDDSLAVIELAQSQAEANSAAIKYKEDQRLYNEIVGLAKKEVVAKTLLAERKSNVANSKALLTQAQAKVKRQQAVVERHQLRAPFDGTIAARNVDLGEWVSPQTRVLQLVSAQSLRVFVDIPQEHFHAIQASDVVPAVVTPDFVSNEVMNLELSQVNGVSDQASRTFQGRIDLPADSPLVSGMSAKVSLMLPSQQSAQVNLPKAALKRHPDGSYSVYSVINNAVKRLSVRLISSNFDKVLVQGVPDNAAIITSGSELLADDMPVTVVSNKGA